MPRIYDGTRYVEIESIQSIGSQPLTGEARPGNGWDHSGSHSMLDMAPRTRSDGTTDPARVKRQRERRQKLKRLRAAEKALVEPTPAPRQIQRKACACGRSYQGIGDRCGRCKRNTHRIVSQVVRAA